MAIPDGKEAKILVGLGRLQDEETGKDIDKVWLYSLMKDKNGRRVLGRHTPVAEVDGNDYVTYEGFAHEEAVALMGMARGIQEMKDRGIFNSIDPSLTSVSDPRHQMMALPKTTSKLPKSGGEPQ